MYTDILKNEHWNYNNYPQQISKNYLSDGVPNRDEFADFIKELIAESKKISRKFDKSLILNIINELNSKNIILNLDLEEHDNSNFNLSFLQYLETKQTSELDQYVSDSDWNNLSYYLRTFVENVLSYKKVLTQISNVFSNVISFLTGSYFIDKSIEYFFGNLVDTHDPLYILGVSKIIDSVGLPKPISWINEAAKNSSLANNLISKLSTKFKWIKKINPVKLTSFAGITGTLASLFFASESSKYTDKNENLDDFVERARELIDTKKSLSKLVLLLKLINYKVYDVPWYRFLEPSVWFLLGGSNKLVTLIETTYKKAYDKYEKAKYEKFIYGYYR
ncbi:hypothetical protein [Mesomycoplasma flocculare]|uniref:hypothetical protein n=1 Tax=Mesomycoplasma flocculare TaxID=2128 RepID=UPI00136EF63F|nr:hypothetical protein [Mesomycoplasma flocculare]MXR05646.1 hypothetical protein [Mesomycoplasma flocculare]